LFRYTSSFWGVCDRFRESVWRHYLSIHEYFATMAITVLRNRDFLSSDRGGNTKVAIVSESMAHHYFGDADPIGRFGSIPGFVGDSSWIQIVGEVRDIKVHDMRESGSFMLYLPLFQMPEGGATFELRTTVEPAYIQNAALESIRSIDPRIPVYSVKTLGVQINDALGQERLIGALSGLFGVIALMLTSIGLYGLIAYTVNRRTNEVGIRMALGADRGKIAAMVLRESLGLVIVGVAVGLLASALATRLIASQLFEIRPWDPATFSGTCLLIFVVLVTASYFPARRAVSVDPLQALRTE
jgi:predicted permease